MVTPEEIDRVDVLYGPFSAAYSGNSVGAVVDYQTKMPTQFEAHGKLGYSSSSFDLYHTRQKNAATMASVSVGNKSGNWSWWASINRSHSLSQPLVFVTKTPAPCGATGCTGTAVQGVVLTKDIFGNNQAVLGTTTRYDTTQDHIKTKLAYDITPTLRAAYTMGYWQNSSKGRPESYLTNSSSGAAVYGGSSSISVNSGGYNYSVGINDFAMSNEALSHMMHGFSLKSNTKETFDYEVALSQYRYQQDELRAPTSYANGVNGGAGTLTNLAGSGWSALALKGTYRPDGMKGVHIYDFGYQQDAYKLSILKNDTTAWDTSAAAAFNTDAGGATRLQSLWGQDTWRVNRDWKTVLGLRSEKWTAVNGHTQTTAVNTPYGTRSEQALSPKAALSFQAKQDVVLKTSIGRAVRFPTAQELYGSTTTANSQFVNNPNLAPEKSVTSEWSIEKDLAYQNGGAATLRITAFFEDSRDSLYSQSILSGNTTITRVQNVGRIRTSGFEVSYVGNDVGVRGLDVSGSLTMADSRIVQNAGYVVTPDDTIGKIQPRVPKTRATGVLSYRWDEKLSAALGARYSGVQYGRLDNADSNGYAYTGVSPFFVADVRLRYVLSQRAGEETSLAVGVDNLNNVTYWNYHAYPQRTLHAELRVDWK